MLLNGQNVVPVVSTLPQNFYQCMQHSVWPKHILSATNFKISLIYAFIGCPLSVNKLKDQMLWLRTCVASVKKLMDVRPYNNR
jgi:hypothetical protein